ncbi:cytochrome P450 [Colletotrichum graminicola]|nr:cytochrome P450 [Colletotrichum graminicola]
MSTSTVKAFIMENTILSLWLFGFIAIIGHVLITTIYRLYFHPLAKFPGPWHYAASQIPISIQRIAGNEPVVFTKLHEKYGQYVRIAPGELSTINPVAVTDVYGHRNATKQVGKDFKVYYMKNGLGDGSESILTASDEDHRRMRKIFTPAFSEKGIRSREGMLKKYTDLFVQKSGEWFDQNGKLALKKHCVATLLCLKVFLDGPDQKEQPSTATSCHLTSTVVFYSHAASFLSATHFARPKEFIPERWLSPPPEEFKTDCLDAVHAFSAGPRDSSAITK